MHNEHFVAKARSNYKSISIRASGTEKTSLWLKGLPKLRETNNVYDYMMTLPIKERTRINWLGSNHAKERSKTYPGIAQAMAEQWGNFLKGKI